MVILELLERASKRKVTAMCILEELKLIEKKNCLRNPVLPSIYVYRAVLDHDIQCTEDFLNWMEQQDVDNQTNWSPSKNNK